MELTIEQKRAMATAQARLRLKRKKQASPENTMAGGVVDAVTQGASLGFGDELTGLESAVLGRTPEGEWFNYDRPFGERYQRAVDAERGQQDRFREENPAVSIGSEVVGGLGTGLGAGRAGLTLMRPGAGLGSNVGRGAAEGMLYGGVAGAGYADQNSRASGAIQGGAVGGLMGGAVSGALGAGTRMLQNRAATQGAPSTQDLRKGADAAYARARQANPEFPAFNEFSGQARTVLDDQGFLPGNEIKVENALREVEKLGRQNSPATFKDLEKIRKSIGNAAGSSDAGERRLGQMLRQGLDDFMEANAPMADVKEGRQLYSRFKKAKMIEDAIEAQTNNAAASGSGGNIDNATRAVAKAILNNPKKRRGFNQQEIEALTEAVRGTPTRNALRLMGKLSPQGNGLMAALTGVGPIAASVGTGNPAFMIPMAVGAVSKTAADNSTRQALLRALATTQRGGALPQQPLMLPDGQKAALLRALSGQAGAVTQ